MPSPFPGMDPYLEAKHWPNFHAWLATEIAGQINPALRPKYAAIVQERMNIVDYGLEEGKVRHRYLDVSVVREVQTPYGGRGGSAVAEPPVIMSAPMPFEEPYLWVEVLTVEDRELVTSI